MYYRIFSNKIPKVLFLGSIISLIVLCSLTAYAHRINLFCKVKNQEIVCSSSYSDGKPVKDAQIKVASKNEDKPLLKGKTNQNGSFKFDISSELKQKKHNLKISVQESMGHRDAWIVNAEEYASTTDQSTKSPTQDTGNTSANASDASAGTKRNWLEKQELEKMISKTISDEIRPLETKIESMLQYKEKQSFQDILGGIGYILGIMGIIFFIKGRSKR